MNKLMLGAVGVLVLGLAAPASAADLPARAYTKAPPLAVAVYDWSGFYIGANGGWGSSRHCWDFSGIETARLAANVSHGCHDSDGGTVGGQIGYNWQMSSWLLGIEAQGNWADFSGSNVSSIFPASTIRSRADAFGLFTGRVGYTWNNALLYVRGGAAVVGDKYDFYPTVGGIISGAASETRWGAAVGVGLEYGFAANWSAALQYDHMFLGERDIRFRSIFANSVDSIHQDIDLITARVNYRWGGPVVARY